MNKTEISNLAASKARETLISGDVETADTVIAETIRTHYDHVLEKTLCKARPAFAQKRASLTKDSNAPAFEWDHQYILPIDYLEMVRFNGDDYYVAQERYEIEGDRLLTNQGAAKIVYIWPQPDTTLYDAEFVEAFALALAAEVVNTVRGDDKRAEGLMALSASEISEVRAKTSQARRRNNSRDRVLATSRWTGGTRRVSTNDSMNGQTAVEYDS